MLTAYYFVCAVCFPPEAGCIDSCVVTSCLSHVCSRAPLGYLPRGVSYHLAPLLRSAKVCALQSTPAVSSLPLLLASKVFSNVAAA